ncbi:hypothetical protein Tco_1254393 [Tanacetum coccineum]
MESDKLVPKISTGSSKRITEIELEHEGSKRKKTNEEKSAKEEKELSEEELHKLMMIVQVEEIYVEALQFKYPIIDWEVYSEDTRKKDSSSTDPTDDKERTLWVELKRDEIERVIPELAAGSLKRDAEEELDQESSKRKKTGESSELAEEPRDKEADELMGIDIYMLVEKEYPLSRGTLTQMLVAKLLVEQDNEMSRELL